jgi:uncharacterized damage-inducible protein DinB
MDSLATLSELFRYADAANDMVFTAASALTDPQLDQPLDLGMGSARKICQHTAAGEVTWLARITGQVEAKWPASPVPAAVDAMRQQIAGAATARQAFLRSLCPGDLNRIQKYRDSKGSLFQVTLQQMLLQMFIHSTHHRSQIVNAIRRVGGQPPEVDYMYHVRQPA